MLCCVVLCCGAVLCCACVVVLCGAVLCCGAVLLLCCVVLLCCSVVLFCCVVVLVEFGCALWDGLCSDDRRRCSSLGEGWSDGHAQGV